ncbi:MAG: argininosuccinate synthase [Planctomycetes bacterium]|nr:argininosuccinate synthase [Planctomycetota bacterium]
MNDKKIVVLAYSGGLDTSFCIPHLKEAHGYEVISVTVNTGGFGPGELEKIEKRARSLGALEHRTVDYRGVVFNRYAAYLIKGNVLRGGVYPLSVAAERAAQAEAVAKVAGEVKAAAVAHGSTGAGNDQVRFDIAFQVLLPGVKILAPIRELKLSRKEEYEYLKARGLQIDKKSEEYSVNTGLWGATIGGGPTHDSWKEIPDEVYAQAAGGAPQEGREYVEIGFQKGVPASLDGRSLEGIRIVEELGRLCQRFGVGRGIHIGDTVLGIKGRIAFQAGAAVVLIHAHRELEKITTTQWQRFWKDHLADFYGKLLHEGLVFEPALRDIEALLDRSQETVTGEARVRLEKERFQVVGVRSPCSMMDAASGVYGEMPKLWTGDDVKGFSIISGIPARLYRGARQHGASRESR